MAHTGKSKKMVHNSVAFTGCSKWSEERCSEQQTLECFRSIVCHWAGGNPQDLHLFAAGRLGVDQYSELGKDIGWTSSSYKAGIRRGKAHRFVESSQLAITREESAITREEQTAATHVSQQCVASGGRFVAGLSFLHSSISVFAREGSVNQALL